MIIIIMIACCYVGALGPEAELILVCAAKLGIHEEKVKVFVISRRSHEMREKKEPISSPRSWKDRGANEAHRCRQRVVARLLRANVAQVHLRLVGEPAV